MDGSQNNYFDKHAVEYFLNTRSVTLELVKNLSAEDMVVQPRDFVSPIKWHLGHTTWFFEKFILILFIKNINLSLKILTLYLIHITIVLAHLIQEIKEVF